MVELMDLPTGSRSLDCIPAKRSAQLDLSGRHVKAHTQVSVVILQTAGPKQSAVTAQEDQTTLAVQSPLMIPHAAVAVPSASLTTRTPTTRTATTRTATTRTPTCHTRIHHQQPQSAIQVASASKARPVHVATPRHARAG